MGEIKGETRSLDYGYMSSMTDAVARSLKSVAF